MIEKTLGQDILNPVQRTRFLKDNCEAVESVGYMKPFKPEEIERKKNRLADVSIELADIEAEKALAVSSFKVRMAPLKEERTELVSDIKVKARYVTEQCYKFVDRDTRRVGYYNNDGQLISERPAMMDELQLSIPFEHSGEMSGTGTEDNL
jgi:hypothetical protein